LGKNTILRTSKILVAPITLPQRSSNATQSGERQRKNTDEPSSRQKPLRVRCVDKPRDNKRKGRGGGGVYIPWC